MHDEWHAGVDYVAVATSDGGNLLCEGHADNVVVAVAADVVVVARH